MFFLRKQKTINNLYFSNNLDKGFAALFITILVLVIFFGIIVSILNLTLGEQKISRNIVASNQAYYAAEAGIEDALLRIKEGMSWTNPYSFSTENATVEIGIPDIITWTRTITATGTAANRFRKVQATYELSGLTPGLYYGAQVGAGGLIIDQQSTVDGNVFSNGDVKLNHPTAIINYSIVIAGAGKKLSGQGTVKEHASVDFCEGDSAAQRIEVLGKLEANNINNCSGSPIISPAVIADPIPLPIDNSQIEEWEEEAATGGTIGTYSIDSGIHYLGPIKIEGDFTVKNTELIINGTIWVTGDIIIEGSGAKVHLSSSYGSASGVIIGGNTIILRNSSESSGSGTPGSYLMYISTSNANPAITIEQSAIVDVLYSNTGWVAISQTSFMKSVNAYGIHLYNQSGLKYDGDLANAFFTSGPSMGWTMTSWKEIE